MLAKNEFEMPHQVAYYECDPHGELTVGMLINLVVLVSGTQSEQLGIGTEFVNSLGGGWVITNYEIDIAQMPKEGADIILGTRATSYNKFFAFREFWVRDAAGVEYARISSIFVFMDFATRKMAPIPPEIIEPYQSEPVKRIPRLARLRELADEQFEQLQRYHVRYFDIDSNHHVNNAHYFDWLLDVLGAEFLNQHRLTKMVIKYEREVRYENGQLVTSQATNPDDQLVTNHRITTKNEVNAEANCWWVERT